MSLHSCSRVWLHVIWATLERRPLLSKTAAVKLSHELTHYADQKGISGVDEVAKYIAEHEEHHRKRSFSEELKLFVERYGLTWRDDKTVETVPVVSSPSPPR